MIRFLFPFFLYDWAHRLKVIQIYMVRFIQKQTNCNDSYVIDSNHIQESWEQEHDAISEITFQFSFLFQMLIQRLNPEKFYEIIISFIGFTNLWYVAPKLVYFSNTVQCLHFHKISNFGIKSSQNLKLHHCMFRVEQRNVRKNVMKQGNIIFNMRKKKTVYITMNLHFILWQKNRITR